MPAARELFGPDQTFWFRYDNFYFSVENFEGAIRFLFKNPSMGQQETILKCFYVLFF